MRESCMLPAQIAKNLFLGASTTVEIHAIEYHENQTSVKAAIATYLLFFRFYVFVIVVACPHASFEAL
jgi:hypothetical protein